MNSSSDICRRRSPSIRRRRSDALHERRPAEAEEMSIEPPGGAAAQKSAMADHTLSIEDDQQEADREKGVAEILRL